MRTTVTAIWRASRDRIGHANVAVTTQIYGHRSTGTDVAAAQKVAGAIVNLLQVDDGSGPSPELPESANPGLVTDLATQRPPETWSPGAVFPGSGDRI